MPRSRRANPAPRNRPLRRQASSSDKQTHAASVSMAMGRAWRMADRPQSHGRGLSLYAPILPEAYANGHFQGAFRSLGEVRAGGQTGPLVRTCPVRIGFLVDNSTLSPFPLLVHGPARRGLFSVNRDPTLGASGIGCMRPKTPPQSHAEFGHILNAQ